MEKDPAFLFYSKDWIEGTAEMSPEAKGVLIDLMAHQHQKKSLPSDTKKLARLCALSEMDFLRIWEAEVKEKFEANGDRLVNRKLTVVMTERLEKGRKNKIAGTLASIVRLHPAPYELKAQAKKGFRVEDFLTISDQELTDRLTEWFDERLKSIEDANGNEDENENKKGGLGETSPEPDYPDQNLLIPQMLQRFKAVAPSYPESRERDAKALLSIAQFLCQRGNLRGAPELNQEPILEAWEQIAFHIAGDAFYCQKSLTTISNHIQEIVQKALHGDKSKSAKNAGRGPAKLDPDKLKAGLSAHFAERRRGTG